MTGYVARLTRGGNYLPLDGTGRLTLVDFVPPSTNEVSQTAGGTSANRYGGSELVSTRAANLDFPFVIKAAGETIAECDQAIRDFERWIKQYAGNKDTPLYFEWRGDNNVSTEPLWGQFGANRRLEVVWGTINHRPRYPIASTREKSQQADVILQVRPYALGKRQRLATASGGVVSDNYGTADGGSRGLIVPEATTNKMTNPVYGHGTWNNGWTSDGLLVVSQNTDPRFLLPGTTSSAKITSQGTGREHYQSINAGNTNDHVLSCYAKRPDGAAVTSSDVVLFYNVALTTVYTSVGDGWYRLSWAGAGINASEETGAQIKNGRTVYLTGWQFEEKGYDLPTPLCYGDLMGCSWSGTAHASTSSRTAGAIFAPVAAETFNLGMGTFRTVIRVNQSSTDFTGSSFYALFAGLGSFTILWDDTNEVWQFSDGTNNSEVSDPDFAAGDIFVLHATWKPGSLILYLNGTAGSDPLAFTPPDTPSGIHLGSTAVGGFHGNLTFMDFAVYGQAMTAAEVAADYANAIQVVNDRQRLAPIPYLWNKDGDGIADNCDDSSRDNWVVAAGIPGTVPAVTEYDLTRSYNSTNEMLIGNISHDYFLPPSTTIFFDQSGTVDANSCGGEYYEETPIGEPSIEVGTGLTDHEYAVLAGKEVVVVGRISGTASTSNTFYARFRYGSVSTSVLTGEAKTVTTTGTGNFFLYRTKPIVLPPSGYLYLGDLNLDGTNQYYSLVFGVAGNTHRFDYFAVLPRPFVVIQPQVATASGTQSFWLTGSRAMTHVSNVVESVATVRGDVMDLEPNKVNILMSFLGDNDDGPAITRTLTYNKVMITPRWSLL